MQGKQCCTCHRYLPLTSFNKRAAAPDGLQARCRDCSSDWYQVNKASHMANVRRRNDRTRRELHQLLATYLSEHPCVDCGERDIRCLEFDHRDGAAKASDVSRMVAVVRPWRAIVDEIEKCDVRCANCHRRITVQRGAWWRQAVYERAQAELQAQTHARLARIFQRT